MKKARTDCAKICDEARVVFYFIANFVVAKWLVVLTSETSYIREVDYTFSNQNLFRVDPFRWDVNPIFPTVCLNGERIPRSLEDPWLEPPLQSIEFESNAQQLYRKATKSLLFSLSLKSHSYTLILSTTGGQSLLYVLLESRAGNRLTSSWSGKAASRGSRAFSFFLSFLLASRASRSGTYFCPFFVRGQECEVGAWLGQSLSTRCPGNQCALFTLYNISSMLSSDELQV